MAALVSGCASFSSEKINECLSNSHVEPRLPPLEIKIERQEIENVYWLQALVKPDVLSNCCVIFYDPEELPNFFSRIKLHNGKIVEIPRDVSGFGQDLQDKLVQGFWWKPGVFAAESFFVEFPQKRILNPVSDNSENQEMKTFLELGIFESMKLGADFIICKPDNCLRDQLPCTRLWEIIGIEETDGESLLIVDKKRNREALSVPELGTTALRIDPGSPNFVRPLKTSSVMVEDAIYIFTEELSRNFFELQGEYRYGYSVCRITQEEVSVDLKWLWPTMATLGILNLFGLPVVALNVEITGEIEILDSAGNPVATYADEGKAKVYSALYWGYRRHALERVAKAYALIEVLENIKKKIQVDALELREKLLNSGKIS